MTINVAKRTNQSGCRLITVQAERDEIGGSAERLFRRTGVGVRAFRVSQHPVIQSVVGIYGECKEAFRPMHLLTYITVPNDLNHVTSPILEFRGPYQTSVTVLYVPGVY